MAIKTKSLEFIYLLASQRQELIKSAMLNVSNNFLKFLPYTLFITELIRTGLQFFFIKYLDYNDFQWTSYLRTFDQPLWTFVGISAIATGLSLWLIDSIFSKGCTTLQPTVTRIPSAICWLVLTKGEVA